MTKTTILLLLTVGLTASATLAADPSKRITVTGRAVGTSEVAVEEAKLDALREAVRRVCGSFINAQSETENFTLVRDKILEQPVGFARILRIVKGPENLEGLTEIQIEAEVFPAAFERRWAEFAHIKEREGNPRCVIVVLEDDNPDDTTPPRINGLVQAELENFFLGKDVQLMDKGVTDEVRIRDLRLAAESGDVTKAAAAGAAFKADVVVLGTAEAREGNTVKVGDQALRRWNVQLVIRAIQTDSAALLVSKTYRPKRALTGSGASAQDALTRVAAENAADILLDIGEAWRKRATVGKMIQMTLEPCTRQQFKAIQAAMAESKGVTGREDGFRLRELANQMASVEVSWKYDLNQLADRMEELSVPFEDTTLRFEITEQSANRITVRIRTEKPPAPAPAPVEASTQPS
ncbi:MAG: hypothetical protein JXA69_00240 [Phycisphaerae bacterium]|nr:hypothetical protein [Phycisphaerae bacterium]